MYEFDPQLKDSEIYYESRKDHDYVNHSERKIEISLANKFYDLFSGNIIEVGAVLVNHGHPYKYMTIDLTDPYCNYYAPRELDREGGRSEKGNFQSYGLSIDAEDYNYRGLNVLSLSTIEHFGINNYSNSEEDYYNNMVVDPVKASRFLNKLFNESNSLLVSVPIGFNNILTKSLKIAIPEISEAETSINWFAYIFENEDWRYIRDVDRLDYIFQFKYQFESPKGAKGVIFLTKNLKFPQTTEK